ncbi:hypothetical protein [Tepidimonas charontis]|uniref:Uncharacterized protein n=1 Tax=Tepidimonas charontis TaxID=2267262 RepID=A0A554XDE2_9BURK|nr:hypothetical protein [Tepidimonas charontis]TSE33861.1 hypothetical protein Tchar_01613 [Tepidimonas charontis]
MAWWSFDTEWSLAQRIVDYIHHTLPAALLTAPAGVVSANKITRTIEHACALALQAQQGKRIGYLGKVALLYRLRARLADFGYPESFIRIATEALLVELSRRRTGAPAKTQ